MRIPAGKIQELPVFDENNKCYLLGTEAYTISLPKRDVKEPLQPGDMVKVFTFYNEEKELEATTKMPDIQVGEVGSFRIVTVNQLGAFIHIGTKRDMLIPMREMRTALEAGKLALVTLQVDHKNERLFASTRLSMYFKNDFIDIERGQEVDLIVADKIDIGRRVIINGKFLGVIFTQEMLRTLREGDKIKGYVRKIEGRDIQVSMSKEGEELIIDAKNRLMEFLENNNGYIRLNDDSDPEEIKLRLRMSKKTFKKAVGVLYKEEKVIITKFGVKLNKGDK
jgi:predicted RNA-binding protein (virulence factor B family)